MISINEHKKAHFDKLALGYLDLVSKICNESSKTSCNEEDAFILKGTNMRFFTSNEDGSCETAWLENGEYKYFLNEESCSIINKCVRDIHSSLKRQVSYQTIQEAIYDWIFAEIQSTQHITLCAFIEDRVNALIDNYTFYFAVPLVYIGNQGSLTISGVTISTIKDESIDKEWAAKLSNIDFDNTAYASITLEGELKALSIIALERVSFAMDILKTCSPLRYQIDPSVFYLDVDQNIRPKIASVMFAKRKGESKLYIEQSSPAHKFDFNQSVINCLNFSRINDFATFMQNYYSEENPSEYYKVIKRCISRFSDSLSLSNRLERNVVLCSILDSLVLTDSEAGIKESLKKYIPIIISEDKDQRLEFKKVLDDMYSNRSQYIHRGIEVHISDETMVKYTNVVFSSIYGYLIRASKYKTIKELCNEIDSLFMSVNLC